MASHQRGQPCAIQEEAYGGEVRFLSLQKCLCALVIMISSVVYFSHSRVNYDLTLAMANVCESDMGLTLIA